VGIAECRALYPDVCGDDDITEFTIKGTTFMYDRYCPCFDGAGFNIPSAVEELPALGTDDISYPACDFDCGDSFSCFTTVESLLGESEIGGECATEPPATEASTTTTAATTTTTTTTKEETTAKTATAKPNILIVHPDDMYPGSGDWEIAPTWESGWTGASVVTNSNTPHMDRVKDEGISFSRAYTASGMCSPSRFALLSGRYPSRNINAISKSRGGAVRVTVPSTLLTGDDLTENLPTVLQACGYATGHVGKCTVLGFLVQQKTYTHWRKASTRAVQYHRSQEFALFSPPAVTMPHVATLKGT